MNKNKVAELIYRLSLSSIPPSVQEQVLGQVEQLSAAEIEALLVILQNLGKVEGDYVQAAERFHEFFLQIVTEPTPNIYLQQVHYLRNIERKGWIWLQQTNRCV